MKLYLKNPHIFRAQTFQGHIKSSEDLNRISSLILNGDFSSHFSLGMEGPVISYPIEERSSRIRSSPFTQYIPHRVPVRRFKTWDPRRKRRRTNDPLPTPTQRYPTLTSRRGARSSTKHPVGRLVLRPKSDRPKTKTGEPLNLVDTQQSL